MTSQISNQSESPTHSSPVLPVDDSRRTSIISEASHTVASQDSVAKTLDKIHTAASRTDTLTTFDFGSPPRPPSSGDIKGLAGDIVQGGFSGLYSRIKATVGGGRDVVPIHGFSESGEDASGTSGKQRPTLSKTGMISPTNMSTPSSRLQSPSTSTFAEHNITQPSPSSLHSQRPSITEQTLVVDIPGVQQPSHSTKSPTPATPIGKEVRRQPTRTQSSGTKAPFTDHPDVDPDRILDSQKIGYNDHTLLTDSDRTPRPLARLMAPDNHRSLVASSVSPARRKLKERNDVDQVTSFKFPTEPLPLRSNLIQVSQSHLPGFQVSRETSVDGDYSSITSGPKTNRPVPSESGEDLNSKASLTNIDPNDPAARLRNKVLAKELWMRDETAKECFYCGEPFSTFRRKHHCRICGNIFDSKCTNLVSGKLFGQSGRIRICKPCEGLVYGNDDDSSVYSDEIEKRPSHSRSISPGTEEKRNDLSDSNFVKTSDLTNFEAPSLGIPVSRKAGENKRGSAVIEFTNEQSLARPSSSRSLKSLSGLYRNPVHKRSNSKQIHQHMKSHSHRFHQDDRAPFQKDPEGSTKVLLPTLHHDTIIDPELAPFMSDDGSSEDDSMSIFATLNGEAQSPGKESDKLGLEAIMGSSRRKAWQSDRGTSITSRDPDSISILSRSLHRQRRRNLSVSSFKPSPKRTKSNSLLKGLTAPFSSSATNSKPLSYPPNGENTKVIRSSTMRGASAPAVELNQGSLDHVKYMLKQMLHDAEIPKPERWQKALMPILLQCTDDVNPDIEGAHDDIDIRQYIKLKKIPGAKPGDTAYVSGVVFTKNLALKSMLRTVSNPRILIVTFPIEYARHYSTFMSLDPVINQEREFLSNLVKQIVQLNPQVLLVEKTVSGIALDLLDKANITVVQNVKLSVLNAVARCTQTNLISSRDQLSMNPAFLGKCASFDVKTYVHGDMKKSFIYFTGCRKDLGCTIVLRGAEIEYLRKLKRIAEFMCYAVYNGKLETCLMRDEYVLIPTNLTRGTLASSKTLQETESLNSTSEPTSTTVSQHLTKSESDGSQNQVSSSEVTSPTAPSRQSTIAVSTGASSTTKVSSEGYEYNESTTSVTPSIYNNLIEEHKTKVISASPFVKFVQPYLLRQARQQEAKLGELKRLRDQYAYQPSDEKEDSSKDQFELVQPEMVHKLLKKPTKQVREFLFAVHDAEYESAKHAYLTQKRQWEAYLQNNPSLFDPFNHQRIAFLYIMVNSKTNPCEGPVNIAIEYYIQHDLSGDFLPDISLGEYVRKLCESGDTKCDSPDCDDTMFNHHRQYVHGDGQMTVTLQSYPSKIRGMYKTILMWSVCRICGKETQVMPMSDNTERFSFGKYLELTFWSTGLYPRTHDCPHDIHRDHFRYLQYNNVAIRIQYDSIQLYEIIVPRTSITWKVDQDLRLKNDLYNRFKNKLDRFMHSVKARIESIHIDSMLPEKIEDCRAEVERLRELCKEDHEHLTKDLQDQYMNSRWYEIISLNRAARAIHENSIRWDEIFAEFEKDFFPSEKDIKRMAALQVKKIFESATSFATGDESTEEVNELETKEKLKEPIGDNQPELSRRISIMSPEILASVIQEQLSENPIVVGNSNQDDETDNLVVPSQNQLAKEVNDREEVKHLDLAISPESSGNGNGAKNESLITTTLPTKPIAVQDLELGTELSRTVEKMRESSSLESDSPPDANMPEITITESKIPRPKETSRRPGLATTLQRTQSQPPGSLLKPLQPGPDISESSFGPTQSKTERLKNILAEPARAFERRMASARSQGKNPPSMIPRSVPGKGNVSKLARQWEQLLSREFEEERLRKRQLQKSRGAYPIASSKPIVEVYRDAHEAVKETDSVDEPDSSTTDRPSLDTINRDHSSIDEGVPKEIAAEMIEEPEKPADAETQSIVSHTSTHDEVEPSIHEDDEDSAIPSTDTIQTSSNESQLELIELQRQEKTSLLKMLTNFWGERSSSGWTPLEYPFAAGEHVWGDSDIVVREDEPSTIIALALSGADYQLKLRSFRKEPENPTPEQIDESIERNLMHSKNTNIRYAFENRGVKAQCKIFYAESFDALRRKTGVSDRFVESLSRCLKWDSKGGKTKSLFLKTLDDRFVLKSLSPIEVNAFFKFAPDYFSFVHAILYDGLPSVIAKMFGLFQVTIRSQGSGLEFNYFMLVMENLFYDRHLSRRFDLKGSMRNRKIQSTGERDEVLLDENLVDIIFEKPIFVREHTMKLLKASVWNDTLFLSKQNVMDYSLMAGFDDEMREIVVGIIDCIRTYTWDKKLETWIKDRGKNKPTVTSPKDYRNRFRVAMSKYILLAPNCWHQFQAQQIQGRPVRLRRGGKVDEELVAGVDVKEGLNLLVGGD